MSSIRAPKISTPILVESLIITQGNSVMASRSVIFGTEWVVLGVLTDRRVSVGVNGDSALIGDNIDLFLKILECESGFRNVCNQNGCKYGQGIAQIIPNTVKYCEEKLGKKIDPFNESDNLECAMWLFEEYSYKPWGTAETVGIWGSYECFKDWIK